MATGLALVPWDPNSQVVRSDDHSGKDGERWALTLRGWDGSAVRRVYTSLGKVVETRANRAAHRFGLGPQAVAEKIKAHFGSGGDRVRQLELLRTSESLLPKLKKKCFKLLKYALPYVLLRPYLNISHVPQH